MKMWIARTNWNHLLLFYDKPIMAGNTHWVDSVTYSVNECISIPSCFFPEVTFENSPMEVELKLIEK